MTSGGNSMNEDTICGICEEKKVDLMLDCFVCYFKISISIVLIV